jgi:hypothetical protein
LALFSVWIKLINFIKFKFINLFQKVKILTNIYKRKEFKLKVPPIDTLLFLLYLYKTTSIHDQLCLKIGYFSIITNEFDWIKPIINNMLKLK